MCTLKNKKTKMLESVFFLKSQMSLSVGWGQNRANRRPGANGGVAKHGHPRAPSKLNGVVRKETVIRNSSIFSFCSFKAMVGLAKSHTLRGFDPPG